MSEKGMLDALFDGTFDVKCERTDKDDGIMIKNLDSIVRAVREDAYCQGWAECLDKGIANIRKRAEARGVERAAQFLNNIRKENPHELWNPDALAARLRELKGKPYGDFRGFGDPWRAKAD